MILIFSSENFLNVILVAADKKHELYLETYVRSYLIRLIKTADSAVNSLFFPNESSLAFDTITLLSNEELSARYILYTISGCQQCPDLSVLIKEKSYRHVADFISFHAKPIGEMIYRLYLQAHLKLPQTEAEKETYFTQLKEELITTNFEAVTKAVSSSHSPAAAQLIISGLKLLDVGTYNTVLLAWSQSDFFSKEFADLDLLHLLENYPWLEAYQADVLSSDFTDGIVKGVRDQPEKVKNWVEYAVNRYSLY